jgi:N-acetylglucosamine kinase-like BadF-type ATPase
MIAVVYSGSRYAFWKLEDKGLIIADFKTQGINPFFNDEKFISQLLNKNTDLINYAEKIKRIYFFGAGASSKARKEIVYDAFNKFFKFGKVTIEHDLLAAAIATCEHEKGIVGIIGSGSNAAYYSGKKIKENNYGLGYILGDEGSSSWMSLQIIKGYLTGNLPDNIQEGFKRKYDLDRKTILEKFYKKPFPTLFLTPFADFIRENKNENYIQSLVNSGFNEYFEKYIIPLKKHHPNVPIHMAGAIAAEFQSNLLHIATTHDIQLSNIVKEPIYNLLNYYSNKN